MQLSEIKNDLATINYSPELNRLMLGDFILIEDNNQSILAQIISIEATLEEDVNSAMLKFLLSIDKEANLTQYSGYVPAKNASLILINPDEVVQLIKSSDKNIHIGNLAAYPDTAVDLSLDFLKKKTYIQVDFVENKLQIVKSIIKGLEKHNRKTLLFDFQGLYESFSLPTVTIGYNFKLPLNYDALCYIAEEELNDFSSENKAIIQGILIEVQNYVKTAKDEFIPFDTLISVLDAQYEESPMSELLLLKNKLLKYQQQGLFAQEKSEFDFLDAFLKDAKNFKFDLSEVPVQWHKIAIVSILNILKTKCYLIIDFNDDNSNKTIIKKLYEKPEIKPIIISSYNYKYQLLLKSMSKNLILFKPLQKISDFAGYTSFLNILSQDTFIVWGEQTLYIPLITKLDFEKEQKFERISYVKLKNSSEVIDENIIDNEVLQETVALNENIENVEPIQTVETVENIESIETVESIENIDDISNDLDENSDFVEENNKISFDEEVYNSQSQTTIIQENQLVDDEPTSSDLDFFFNDEDNELKDVENNIDELMEKEQESFNEQINEYSVNSAEVEPEIIENFEFEDENTIDNNDETVEDLSETVLDENLLDNASEPEQINSTTQNVQPNEDLEYINSELTEEQEDMQNEETLTRPVEVKTASVPVYTSNVAPQFNTKFAQGTFVHHPKYGRGTVEKVINYGSKELCLIIFDNEGRKLLDPNLAELKQI